MLQILLAFDDLLSKILLLPYMNYRQSNMTAIYKRADIQLYQVYTYQVENMGNGNESKSDVMYCYASSTPARTLGMPCWNVTALYTMHLLNMDCMQVVRKIETVSLQSEISCGVCNCAHAQLHAPAEQQW